MRQNDSTFRAVHALSYIVLSAAILFAVAQPADAAASVPTGGPSCSGFAPAVSYEVVSDYYNFTMGVAIADFNGDAYQDLAVTAYDTYGLDRNFVTILLGSRTGAFTVGTKYPVGLNPTSVVAADFNGDQRNDLAIAHTASPDGSVSILFGDGMGGFAIAKEYAVGDTPRSIALGDFNEDGYPDLVTANTTSGTLGILLGNAAGTFIRTEVPADEFMNPMAVAVGDFNRDGHQDLAAAVYGEVGVRFGAGDGTFSGAAYYGAGTYISDVIAVDLDGDRVLDLATTSYHGGVSVLLGRRDGSFGDAVAYAVGDYPFSLAAADLDGDHHVDLAVANMSSGDVSILHGLGDGAFSPAENIQLRWGIYTVAIGDFNSDRRPDLAVSNYTAVSVLLNGCASDGSFVTGGGWIDSPAGAYATDRSREGKASFGLVAKYVKSSDVPVGHTEFNFPAASFRFDSTSYEGLLVAGATAQYWGTGRANGRAGYGFRVTATDGRPDGMRLEVWDSVTGSTVYDNLPGAPGGTTPIGGGSIEIH